MLQALLGGALIGVAATWYWVANGRVAGVSGIVSAALHERGQRSDRLLFLAGLAIAGVAALIGSAPPAVAAPPLPVLLVAGLLVGFGTRVAGGCTSGHGVCGVSRLSRRSLVAVITFMAVGAATVAVVARLLPQWTVR
ncbi:MAG TPA: YeeE/YedE thiosulfate transporter family protein [Polyangia bacterium]|jgi:uncharacterized membrane protein YedE/YeeE|nr:YeeE/YedE thiosulfate transporter family protein [Polyangia bacterium]